MAERRMFAKTIIDSDSFIDMPLTAQALYFHLCMRADDDGFVNNPKKIHRMIGCDDKDALILIDKAFVIPFPSGVWAIKHWKIHNYIQADRYKETVYTEEKNLLTTKENKAYTLLNQSSIHNVSTLDTQSSIESGKSSIELGEIDKAPTTGAPALPVDYNYIVSLFNNTCVSLPKVKEITAARRKSISRAIKQLNSVTFEELFEKVELSDFVTGRNNKWNGGCFDWILKPANIVKIIEGNYDNKTVKHVKRSNANYDIEEYNRNSIEEPIIYKKKSMPGNRNTKSGPVPAPVSIPT